MSRLRLAAAAAAALVLACGLSGCSVTQATCVVGSCTVSLVGEGASVTLDGEGFDGVVVTLDSSSAGTARFAVDGDSGVCGQGQDVRVGGFGVFCSEVGEDSAQLTVSS